MERGNYYAEKQNDEVFTVWERKPDGDRELVGYLDYDATNDCWINHTDSILYPEPDQAFHGLIEVLAE